MYGSDIVVEKALLSRLIIICSTLLQYQKLLIPLSLYETTIIIVEPVIIVKSVVVTICVWREPSIRKRHVIDPRDRLEASKLQILQSVSKVIQNDICACFFDVFTK